MSRSLSINLYLKHCSIAIYGNSIYAVCTISDFFWSVNCKKIRSINYALRFGIVKIHEDYLCWSVFSTDINRKIIFNRLPLFKLLLLVSKLYKLSQ